MQAVTLGDKGHLYKGQLEVSFKNVVQDLQSKKTTWSDLNILEDIKKGLYELKFDKPSII